MGFTQWFERRMMGMEVLADYGEVYSQHFGIGRRRSSLVLCRWKRKLRIAVRVVTTSCFGAGIAYSFMDITPETLQKLSTAVSDAEQRLRTEGRESADSELRLPPRLRS